MKIIRSSINTAKGPQDWFTGEVYIDAVATAPPPSRMSANLVHFMPGARTHWHRPPLSQSVFVTEGIGLCQRRGGPIEVIRPGDGVLFEADEEHWHGAAPNRLMVHIAINEGDDDHDVVQWPSPVTDAEYGQARRPAVNSSAHRCDAVAVYWGTPRVDGDDQPGRTSSVAARGPSSCR